jgi:hypothetical protein
LHFPVGPEYHLCRTVRYPIAKEGLVTDFHLNSPASKRVLMLQFPRPLHCSATVQLGALTTRPSLSSMPNKERSSYLGRAFDCFPAFGSARYAAVVSSNRPASRYRAIALRTPSLLSTCGSILHLRQVSQRTVIIPEERACTSTWGRRSPC